VIFLHVCPQCTSQYCNPFGCRFTGRLNPCLTANAEILMRAGLGITIPLDAMDRTEAK
jgi:hypothetical protein